jgi:hypothetical protein
MKCEMAADDAEEGQRPQAEEGEEDEDSVCCPGQLLECFDDCALPHSSSFQGTGINRSSLAMWSYQVNFAHAPLFRVSFGAPNE